MIRPDRPGMAVTAVALATVVAVAAFFISFEALTQIGRTLELPLPWLVPIALDGAILAATALLLVEASRGHRGALPWAIVYGSTLASSAANGWSHWERGQGLAPSATAALAPWLLLVLTHAIAHILVDGERAPEQVAPEMVVTPEQPAEARAVILRETPIMRPAVDAKQPARRVERDAETVLPEVREQPAEVAAPAPTVDAKQVTEHASREVPEQVESAVPEVTEQPVRPVPAVPTRPVLSTPARKAVSTVTATGSGTTAYADLDEDGQAARRAEAVAAVQSGQSVAGTAKRLAVPRSSLQRWVAAEAESIAA